MPVVSGVLLRGGRLAGTAVVAVGCPTLLLTALGLWPTCSAAAQTATFDFDTGTPALITGRNVPFDQTSGGITASFSALAGGFSVQTDGSTGFSLSQFSGRYLYPNTVRGSALRIQFGRELTDIRFTFATTDYALSHPTPTPIVLTAFSVTPTLTNTVGSATSGATYGSDKFPMGTLTFNPGSKTFNRVEVRIQAGGDATFLLDNVTVTPVPQLNIWAADSNSVVVAWLWPSTGFVLQQNSALGTTGWVNVTNTVEVVNGENQVLISPATGGDYYRLFHP